MKLVEGLYTYNISKYKKNRICSHIRKHKPAKKLYLIVLPIRGNDGLFEIYPYNQLLQKYYLQFDSQITIVGIAGTKEEAQRLVVEIVQDMYDSMGESFDINKFFCIGNETCGFVSDSDES